VLNQREGESGRGERGRCSACDGWGVGIMAGPDRMEG